MTDSKCKMMPDGSIHWLNKEGNLHRLDGPAFEDVRGKWWYADGKLHHANGPAIEWHDGTKQWWVDDRCHRLEGPAVEWASGEKSWFVCDVPLTQQQFDQHPLVIFYRLCR